MEDITKKYDNSEITVVWQPGLCIHFGRCAMGLPAVFNPAQKPWINVSGADSEAIMHQIDQCPSGALSYIKTDK